MKLSLYTKSIIISFFDTLVVNFCGTFIISYLPEMTDYFGYREEDKGYYGGAISAAYPLGMILGCYILAHLSDIYGHHKLLIILHSVNAFLNLILGFCQDIYSVFAIRLLSGCTHTVGPIVRAVVVKNSDDRTLSKALVLNRVGWAMGMAAGTAIGGFLSSPATKYKQVFGKSAFLAMFPFILTPLVASLVNIIAAVTTYFLFPYDDKSYSSVSGSVTTEDMSGTAHERNSNKYHSTEDRSHSSQCGPGTSENMSLMTRGWNSEPYHSTEDRSHSSQSGPGTSDNMLLTTRGWNFKPYHSTEDISHSSLSNSVTSEDMKRTRHGQNCKPYRRTDDESHSLEHKNDDKKVKFGSISCHRLIECFKQSTIHILISDINTVKCVLMYTLCGVLSPYSEITSIWASTITDLQGLGYTSTQIGTILSIVTIPAAIIQIVIVPPLEKRIGPIKSCVLFMFISTISLTITPTCRRILNHYSQWWCLLACEFCMNLFLAAGDTCILILLSHTMPDNLQGALNGLAGSFSAVIKAIGPVVAGATFAASITSDIGSPVDYNLAFVLLGVVNFATVCIAYGLPSYLNYRYN